MNYHPRKHNTARTYIIYVNTETYSERGKATSEERARNRGHFKMLNMINGK